MREAKIEKVKLKLRVSFPEVKKMAFKIPFTLVTSLITKKSNLGTELF